MGNYVMNSLMCTWCYSTCGTSDVVCVCVCVCAGDEGVGC